MDSPAAAALAGWPEAANGRVVAASVIGDRAEVVLDTGPEYRYWVYCVRRDGQWQEIASANAPTEGWHDPNLFDWDY